MQLHKTIAIAALIAAGMASPAMSHGYEIGDIAIGHPFSREAPEGARVIAGYASLTNGGTEADRLVEVRSDIAESAEIHEMAVDGNGVMTMRPLADGLEIPAGAEVDLAPGSFHIMFMGPDRSYKEGDRFKGTLVFEKAGEVEVEFAVEARGGADAHSGH